MMSLKHIASASIAVIASAALAATMSMPANAAPSIGASGQTVVTASNQSETNNLAEKMKALKSGESFTYSSPTGDKFKVTNVNGQLNFSAITDSSISSPAASWCATSLAAVIAGIGATALAAAAVATGGGSVVIAGVTLSGAQLGGLAAVAASYSALEAYIDSKIC
ncbi:hypothetical protein ACTXM3_18010 [Glutamicibacter arilaitensis]|nr:MULTISPECIES: hypothetical protein [Bacteria]MEB7626324.1 hypothetical protein [Enterobacter vonholyi]